MSSASRNILMLACVAAADGAQPPLRVCADPNNPPFSTRDRSGFENRIVERIAARLGTHVEYTWWADRRGRVREALNAGRCDVIAGVAASVERVLATVPYYRSTYVFVTRRDRALRITSFDDSTLHHLRIGVGLVGDDGTNTPPAHALLARGHVTNVRGYLLTANHAERDPQSALIRDVVGGVIDVAVAWGPVAGYYAARSRVPLDVVPVSPAIDVPFLPFVYDIAMGVRRADTTRQRQLNAALQGERVAIGRILDRYHVPRVGVSRRASAP